MRPASDSEDCRSKVGRGAAEDEKSRGERPSVGQDAQQRKQIGTALDLVNHHQLLERPQSGVRLGQAVPSSGILEIEVIEGIGGNKLTGQAWSCRTAWAPGGRRPGCGVKRSG